MATETATLPRHRGIKPLYCTQCGQYSHVWLIPEPGDEGPMFPMCRPCARELDIV